MQRDSPKKRVVKRVLTSGLLAALIGSSVRDIQNFFGNRKDIEWVKQQRIEVGQREGKILDEISSLRASLEKDLEPIIGKAPHSLSDLIRAIGTGGKYQEKVFAENKGWGRKFKLEANRRFPKKYDELRFKQLRIEPTRKEVQRDMHILGGFEAGKRLEMENFRRRGMFVAGFGLLGATAGIASHSVRKLRRPQHRPPRARRR